MGTKDKSYHSGIHYSNLLANSSLMQPTTKEIGHLTSEIPNNYEEVDDYSFLNIVTEEITNLDNIHNGNDLKELLNNCLTDINSEEVDQTLSDKVIDNVISNLENSECKAYLHNVDNLSYLEIVNENNDHSYTVQLNHVQANFSNNLDDVLTFLIENNPHKV